jgi:hypothetical protein
MRWPELLDVMAYVGDVMTESGECGVIGVVTRGAKS